MEKKNEKQLTVENLCELTGRSRTIIYRLAKKLGRLPTVEEVTGRAKGRPKKY